MSAVANQANGHSGAVASTSASNTAATTGKPVVQPSEVGWLFVPQYYTFLNQNPERLHCFYTKKSTLIHGTESEEESPCFGQQEIHEKITSKGFSDCKVYISNVDSQSSASGGILIQVLGEMSNKSGPWRKFAQTFFLAEQPNGYFVLNDIFRYLKDEEETEEQAEEVEADVRNDEGVAREENRDVAGAKVDVSAVMQPGATPSVQPIVASSDQQTKPPAITSANAPQDNSITAADEGPQSVPEAVAEQPESAGDAAATAAQEPVAPEEAAKEETIPAAVAAAGPAATGSAPAAPAPAAAPTGPPKPKTWANLAASNATTWGTAVRADAKGVSAAATAAANNRANEAAGASKAAAAANQSSGGRPAGSARGAASTEPGAVFIKNAQVDHGVTEAALRSTLEAQFGPLKEMQLVPTRGCAFATFSTPEAARQAITASSSQGGIVVGEQGWKVSVEEKRQKLPGSDRPAGGAATGGARGGRGGSAGGDRGGFRNVEGSGRGGRGGGRGGRGGAGGAAKAPAA